MTSGGPAKGFERAFRGGRSKPGTRSEIISGLNRSARRPALTFMSFLVAFLAFSALIVLHGPGTSPPPRRWGLRFFLFFPPKLVSDQAGRPNTGSGDPAGGFVRITGMNPDEELPRKSPPPRLLATNRSGSGSW